MDILKYSLSEIYFPSFKSFKHTQGLLILEPNYLNGMEKQREIMGERYTLYINVFVRVCCGLDVNAPHMLCV